MGFWLFGKLLFLFFLFDVFFDGLRGSYNFFKKNRSKSQRYAGSKLSMYMPTTEVGNPAIEPKYNNKKEYFYEKPKSNRVFFSSYFFWYYSPLWLRLQMRYQSHNLFRQGSVN
jgi:hypothetical protein